METNLICYTPVIILLLIKSFLITTREDATHKITRFRSVHIRQQPPNCICGWQ